MKRWRSRITAIVVAIVMVASLIGFAAPAGAAEGCESCSACGDWVEYPLFAGQTWQVGVVRVNNCEDQIGVQYVLDPAITAAPHNYRITEVHLAIGDDPQDIPQTKKNNPIPGEFPVNESFESGVTESPIYCFDREAGWVAGKTLVVAAHAVVGRPALSVTESQPFCVVSDTTSAFMTGPDTWAPAAIAWGDHIWNNYVSTNLQALYGARWIWNSYRTLDPVNGEIVEFSKEFTLEGTPTSGTLYATADNGFEASLNTNLVGDSGNLFGDWRNSDLTEQYVFASSGGMGTWSQVKSFDVTPYLASGLNELAITGVNENMDGGNGGTIDSNPAGVIYALCGTMDVELYSNEEVYESAWGDGPQFDGKNWATYIEYGIRQWELVDTVAVYGHGTASYIPVHYYSTLDLAEGVQYRLTASGTYRFGEWGDYGLADAQFNNRTSSIPPYVAGWQQLTSNYLQVWVDGAVADWTDPDTGLPDAYNPAHVYNLCYRGTGAPIDLTVIDSAYTDNNKYWNPITVDIYAWR